MDQNHLGTCQRLCFVLKFVTVLDVIYQPSSSLNYQRLSRVLAEALLLTHSLSAQTFPAATLG